MSEIKNSKSYDLEERTFTFAQRVRKFVKKLPKNMVNYQDCPQLIRSSGSVGANYIEANDSISPKDFLHRIKISRKEAKESKFWLRLIETEDSDLEVERVALINEANELMLILSSIMRNSEKKV